MSTEQPIQRLSSTTNAAVVHLPERQYPGVVVQGDSLHNLSLLVQEIADQIAQKDYQEATGVAEEVLQILQGYLASYESAIGSPINLPYSKS